MRYWLMGTFAMTLVLGACGGSVTKDDEGTGGSGTGGDTPGTGAVAGTGGFAGTGAVTGGGGYAGTAGGGGWSGTPGGGGWSGTPGGGGYAGGTAGGGGYPGCCASDLDCPQYAETGLSTECIAGVCKEIPPPGQCWDDADCYGSQCVGGSVCPCTADCFAADSLGWCTSKPPPPPAGCCKTDDDCGDYAWMPCVKGVCKLPASPGYCWVDAECPMGKKCVGASVCPCGFECGMIEAPGTCQ